MGRNSAIAAWSGQFSSQLRSAETIQPVVVHHTDGLHMRIHDRRTNEAEAPLFEVFAERVGNRRAGWHVFAHAHAVLKRHAIDETPLVVCEAAKLFLDLQEG